MTSRALLRSGALLGAALILLIGTASAQDDAGSSPASFFQDRGIAVTGEPTPGSLATVADVFSRFGDGPLDGLQRVNFRPQTRGGVQGWFQTGGDGGQITFTPRAGEDVDPYTAAFLGAHAWGAGSPRTRDDLLSRLPSGYEGYPNQFSATGRANQFAGNVAAGLTGDARDGWDPGAGAMGWLQDQGLRLDPGVADRYGLPPGPDGAAGAALGGATGGVLGGAAGAGLGPGAATGGISSGFSGVGAGLFGQGGPPLGGAPSATGSTGAEGLPMGDSSGGPVFP